MRCHSELTKKEKDKLSRSYVVASVKLINLLCDEIDINRDNFFV